MPVLDKLGMVQQTGAFETYKRFIRKDKAVKFVMKMHWGRPIIEHLEIESSNLFEVSLCSPDLDPLDYCSFPNMK